MASLLDSCPDEPRISFFKDPGPEDFELAQGVSPINLFPKEPESPLNFRKIMDLDR